MSRPSNLHTQLANQVLEYIQLMELEGGAHLPEPDLCERFNVSRTPIRAALRLLSKQGLVRHIPKRGYFTRQTEEQPTDAGLPRSAEDTLYLEIAEDRINRRLPARNSEADLLRKYSVSRGELVRVLQRLLREGLVEKLPGRGWMFSPVLHSKKMHDESYRFRLAIEPLALQEPGFALDAEKALACELKHQRILDGEVQQISPIELFEINAEFHELIAAGAHNRFFVQAIQQQNRLRRFVNYHWTYGPERVMETCREHMAVFRAVREGDLDWAASLLRRHLDISSKVSPYSEPPNAEGEIVQGAPEYMIKLTH